MKPIHIAMSLATALCLSGPASAGPKPADAQAADPQTIANFYGGKSQTWSNCNGGIYFGGNWQAVAWCERDGDAVGIGTWKVDRNGTRCHDLTWYWPEEGGKVGSDTPGINPEHCDEHIQAADGTIFARWQKKKGDPDAWWQPETADSVTAGFDRDLRRKINRMRKRLGV